MHSAFTKNTWIKHCPGARQQDRLRCVTLNSPGRNIDSHLVPPPNRFTNEAGEDRRVMTPRRELSTCHMETAATAKTHYLLCARSVFLGGFFPSACPFYTEPVCRNQILWQWNTSGSKIRPDECRVFGWLCWYERKLMWRQSTLLQILHDCHSHLNVVTSKTVKITFVVSFVVKLK